MKYIYPKETRQFVFYSWVGMPSLIWITLLVLYCTSVVVNFSSFLFFKLLLLYSGRKSWTLLPFTLNSPISGQVGSSAPFLPSSRMHLTSIDKPICLLFIAKERVFIGACYVGWKGTGSQRTSTILCIGSSLNKTHSGHINYFQFG